jgi:Carboxypeptidase regulatory-like domain
MSRKSRRPRLLGALILLLLLALLLPLGNLLTGFLPGGKSRAEPAREAEPRDSKGSLRVTVVRAEDREPVEGARVLVEGLSGGEAEAESDAHGRVEVKGLGAGPVRVETTVGGRKAETWADPAVTPEILLAVGPERRRSGRVTPAPARVVVIGEEGSEVASAETDAEGRYDLPDVAGSICAMKDGFAPAVAERGDLVLREGRLIEGRLIGGGAGDLAVMGLMPSPGNDEMLPFRTTWKVEKDGGFRGRLPEGAEAFGIFRGLPVRIASGEVALPAPAQAKGVVRREDGSAAARAVLLFRPLLDADFAPPLPGLRVEADARGEFTATGFSAVRYSVEAYAPGCARLVLADVEVGEKPLEIVLAPGFSIGGFVVDAAGLPVPRARVSAVGLPEQDGRPVITTTADEQGRFELTGLGGTHARLRVTADGHHATTLDRLPPTTTLRVVLQVNG